MESEFSDTDAIAALCTDQPQRFSAFVSHYQYPLFGFLGRLGFSQADAEDLAQDIFLRAWKYRHTFNPDKARPSTWLFTIARNTAINLFNQRRPELAETNETAAIADPLAQPDRGLQRQQQQQLLSGALAQLPLDDRCAIALFYLNDLSSAQSASVMQCSVAAFKTRLSRARSKLKAILISMDALQ